MVPNLRLLVQCLSPEEQGSPARAAGVAPSLIPSPSPTAFLLLAFPGFLPCFPWLNTNMQILPVHFESHWYSGACKLSVCRISPKSEVEMCINWSMTEWMRGVTYELPENLREPLQPEQSWGYQTASPLERRGKRILCSLTPPGTKNAFSSSLSQKCQQQPLPLPARRACYWCT